MFKIKKKKETGDVRKLIQLAVQNHQSGGLRQAETIYRKILKENPEHFDALHMLGVLYAQMKNRDLAVRFIEKAIRVNPSDAHAHYNLGNVFRDGGEFGKASACYEKIIELHRNDDRTLGDLEVVLVDKGELDGAVGSHPGGDDRSILIAVPAFNRKKITRLSLAQTQRFKAPRCHLQVYNDHSTEYDNSFLEPYADEVIQLPSKLGINLLRWHQFRVFLKTDFDLLYLTDSDVIHDPRYIAALEVLYDMGNRELPVCLFNSAYHMEPRIILYRMNGVMLKGTAPGVSMLYDRKMAEKIVAMLDRHQDTSVWDFTALKYLGLPWLTPETSYLEHYGGGGIHNVDYERDRAIRPTKYLQETRQTILKYLADDELPPPILPEGGAP